MPKPTARGVPVIPTTPPRRTAEIKTDDILDDPNFVVRVVALFCSAICFTGSRGDHVRVITVADKFEKYLRVGKEGD
jgi:hypothetical protein